MEKKSPFKSGGMFEGAVPGVFVHAKQLRGTMTDAEMVLWLHIKAGIAGCKFRRQHPIRPFIADFYCHKAKLVIEVDGAIHQNKEVIEWDKDKEDFLQQNGYNVMRFTNDEVLKSVETVIESITTTVNKILQNALQTTESKSPL